jgi:hypothetical protein
MILGFIVLFAAAMGFCAAANALAFRMLNALNEVLPPERRIIIGPFQNYKWWFVWREFKRTFPQSRQLRVFVLMTLGMFVCLLGSFYWLLYRKAL